MAEKSNKARRILILGSLGVLGFVTVSTTIGCNPPTSVLATSLSEEEICSKINAHNFKFKQVALANKKADKTFVEHFKTVVSDDVVDNFKLGVSSNTPLFKIENICVLNADGKGIKKELKDEDINTFNEEEKLIEVTYSLGKLKNQTFNIQFTSFKDKAGEEFVSYASSDPLNSALLNSLNTYLTELEDKLNLRLAINRSIKTLVERLIQNPKNIDFETLKEKTKSLIDQFSQAETKLVDEEEDSKTNFVASLGNWEVKLKELLKDEKETSLNFNDLAEYLLELKGNETQTEHSVKSSIFSPKILAKLNILKTIYDMSCEYNYNATTVQGIKEKMKEINTQKSKLEKKNNNNIKIKQLVDATDFLSQNPEFDFQRLENNHKFLNFLLESSEQLQTLISNSQSLIIDGKQKIGDFKSEQERIQTWINDLKLEEFKELQIETKWAKDQNIYDSVLKNLVTCFSSLNSIASERIKEDFDFDPIIVDLLINIKHQIDEIEKTKADYLETHKKLIDSVSLDQLKADLASKIEAKNQEISNLEKFQYQEVQKSLAEDQNDIGVTEREKKISNLEKFQDQEVQKSLAEDQNDIGVTEIEKKISDLKKECDQLQKQLETENNKFQINDQERKDLKQYFGKLQNHLVDICQKFNNKKDKIYNMKNTLKDRIVQIEKELNASEKNIDINIAKRQTLSKCMYEFYKLIKENQDKVSMEKDKLSNYFKLQQELEEKINSLLA